MIKSEDIFYKYNTVNDIVNDLVKENKEEELDNTVKGFVSYLTKNKPEYSETELENISNFLSNIPIKNSMTYVDEVSTWEKETEEFRYIAIIHAKLMSGSKQYRDLYQRLVDYGQNKSS